MCSLCMKQNVTNICSISSFPGNLSYLAYSSHCRTSLELQICAIGELWRTRQWH